MMRPSPIAVLIYLALWLPSGALGAKIELKNEAVVDGPGLALADVATVSDAEPEFAAKLLAIDLGPAPWPGTRHRVDGIVVRLRLYQNHIDPRNVSVDATAGCDVTTRPLAISSDRISQLAREHLAAQIRWPASDVEIEMTSEPRDYVVPAGCGRDVMKAKIVSGNRLSGPVEVAVSIVVAGKTRFKVPVGFYVRLYKDVVTTTAAVGRNDTLAADNVKLKRTDVTTNSDDLVTDLAKVLGQRTTQPLAADTALTRRMFVAPPVVRRGDVVRIVYRLKGLVVSVQGEVRQNGAEGDRIRVVNIDSGRVLVGVVVDSKTVVVGG